MEHPGRGRANNFWVIVSRIAVCLALIDLKERHDLRDGEKFAHFGPLCFSPVAGEMEEGDFLPRQNSPSVGDHVNSGQGFGTELEQLRIASGNLILSLAAN
jgi:hypothetical protein